VLIVSKILIAISLVGLLRCSATFRTSSREFDERVFAALKRMMLAAEDNGYPAELAPMLILLSALCFMLSMQFLQFR
jgi:hypothetical protein